MDKEYKQMSEPFEYQNRRWFLAREVFLTNNPTEIEEQIEEVPLKDRAYVPFDVAARLVSPDSSTYEHVISESWVKKNIDDAWIITDDGWAIRTSHH